MVVDVSSSPKTYVIGASGYVGSAIAARLAADGESVVGTYNSTPSHTAGMQFDFWSDSLTDFTDADGVVFSSTVERDNRPFDRFEQRADALTDACSQTRFVYLSSDAVFGGESGQYSEDASTNPVNQYGQRTARFETFVRENCSDYCIIRPSYVYGFSGGVLDDRLTRTFRALRSGKRVTYYEDYFKSPIEVNQLAEIVRRVYVSGFCGTLHAGGPRMSVYQFHRRTASAFGAQGALIGSENIPPERSLPRDTSLDSNRLSQEFSLQPGPVIDSLTCSSVEDILGR